MISLPPSGRQHVIQRGPQRAVVTEVGATLRSYTVDGIELLDTFAEEAMSDYSRGQVLAPWPNRIDHGRYSFAGRDRQLALTEPERDNAIHGLVRWRPFIEGSTQAESVRLSCALYPQKGYEFSLLIDITYALTGVGLEVRLNVHNRGTEPAPVGAGYHPYLAAGSGGVDDVQVRMRAATVLTTNDRLVPTGEAPVQGTDLDFTSMRRLGDTRLDHCFTDLRRDNDGMVRVEFAPPSRPGVVLFMDEQHDYIQVFTGDAIGDESRRRRGLAVEPMTCAPDAFNNGKGLRVLEPGEAFVSRWGISTIT
ncbi:MAG: aldose 1-epimerase family protein [Actinomycetota bacterium]